MSHSLLLLTDFFIIIIGLTTTGFFIRFSVITLEFSGTIQAMTKTVARLQKLPASLSAYPIGLVMGFLPCGFLYAIALAAAGRGSPVEGGLIMLVFGRGTLPSLFFFRLRRSLADHKNQEGNAALGRNTYGVHGMLQPLSAYTADELVIGAIKLQKSCAKRGNFSCHISWSNHGENFYVWQIR